MEEAAVIMTGLDIDRVLGGLDILKSQPRGETRTLQIAADYGVPNVSETVVRIVQSYTDYVTRVVGQRTPRGTNSE